MRDGVLYVAYGWPYLLLSLQSIRSLRSESPGLPVAVVTSPGLHAALSQSQTGLADHWIPIDLPMARNREVKTAADLHSPFDRTLMLDSDTLVVGDVRPMFEWLDYFDLGFKLNEARMSSSGNIEKGSELVLDGRATVDELPHWNGAVCLFKKSPGTRSFFSLWSARYASLGSPFDQVSLVDALFLSSARAISFDYRWNSPMKSYRNSRKGQDVVIIHYGSDIPAEVIEAVRTDATDLRDQSGAATIQASEFFESRTRAREEKNRFLGKSAMSPRRPSGPVSAVKSLIHRLRRR